MSGKKRLARRDFLKRTAALGAGAAASMAGAERLTGWAIPPTAAPGAEKPKTESRNVRPGILYRRLGRTNFMVSALAFGGYKLAPETLGVFEAAVEKGVNFIMVHAGTGAATLGDWMAKDKARRERIFIGLAVDPKKLDAELRALKVDAVDLLMPGLHDPKAVASAETAERFAAIKKAGKARYVCLAFHNNVPQVWKAALEANLCDALLPTYNFPSRSDLKPLIAEAKKQDVGVLAMKTARALAKDQDYVAACKTFLADGIDAVVKSIQSAKELEDLMRMAREGDQTKPAEPAPVACAGQCSLCGACADCPAQVAIQDILRTYQYYALDLGWMEQAYRQYAAIPMDRLAGACTDCGRCEAVCPRGLPIRQLLRDAQTELELDMVRGAIANRRL